MSEPIPPMDTDVGKILLISLRKGIPNKPLRKAVLQANLIADLQARMEVLMKEYDNSMIIICEELI